MATRAWEEMPQIVAIVPVSRDGKVSLKKAVRQQLGLQEAQALYLDVQDEVLLSADPNRGQEITPVGGSRPQLPESVRTRLGLSGGSLVGLVQRPNAVAVKAIEIAEAAADRARLVDVESADRIVRWVETTPMPEDLLPRRNPPSLIRGSHAGRRRAAASTCFAWTSISRDASSSRHAR